MGNTKHTGFLKGRKNPVGLRRGVAASRCPGTTPPDICPWHQLTFRPPLLPRGLRGPSKGRAWESPLSCTQGRRGCWNQTSYF